MKENRKNWLFALALTIPMIVFFAGYLFNHDDSIHPTGFIQYDNVSYIAYAKQYIDSDRSSLLYSNPFNDSDEHRPIYFQVQTLFFALLLKLGVPPGWILIPFTFICSLVCFRILIGIYDHIVSYKKYRCLTLWLLAWGGGILALSGIITQQLSPHPGADSVFVLDPADGWWGLNFGRSLFFSCEAYFHALFLASVYFLLKQKWAYSFLFCFILSASHPFTGVENLSIICCWIVADKFIFKNRNIPAWFIVAALALLCLHVFYYLYYLNLFPDHRSVSEQYQLNWRLRFFNMLPAYCIAGSLAVAQFIRSKPFSKSWPDAQRRLFIAWFLVAFCLANHEVLIKPQQPIHFTRGYIWTSLMLLGIPAIHLLMDTLNRSRPGRLALLLFLLLFFSDNSTWIGLFASSKDQTTSTIYINNEHKQVFDTLNSRATNRSLIIGTDLIIPYMSAVYTSGYPYYSHPYTTPYAARKKASLVSFIREGTIDSTWRGRDAFFIFEKNDSLQQRRLLSLGFPAKQLLETNNYQLFEANIP